MKTNTEDFNESSVSGLRQGGVEIKHSTPLKFLNEKPLDQITVKDVVDDCGINRKTIYYYFQDIYALTDDIFRSRLEEIKLSLPPKEHSWQEVLKAIAEFLLISRRASFGLS